MVRGQTVINNPDYQFEFALRIDPAMVQAFLYAEPAPPFKQVTEHVWEFNPDEAYQWFQDYPDAIQDDHSWKWFEQVLEETARVGYKFILLVEYSYE